MNIRGAWESSLGFIKKNVDADAQVSWMDGKPSIDDRWKAAARDGDRRYDAAMRIARDRGLIAIGVSVIAIGLGGGWYLQAQKSSVETVFIPFNQIGEPGEVFVARANTPPDLMKVWAAEDIVKALFAVSSDDNVNSDNKAKRDRVLRGAADQQYRSWEQSVKDKASQRQVAIVSSKQRSPDTINVIWDETDWSSGHVIGHRRMNGDFSFKFIAPVKAGQIALNKSGLFLMDMTFAPERGS